MTNAPEVFCKEAHDSWGQYGHWSLDGTSGGKKFIPFDLHLALVAAAKREARNEARREAAKRISAAEQGGRGEDMIVRDWAIEAILAQMEDTDDE